jgi:hypothetical protein
MLTAAPTPARPTSNPIPAASPLGDDPEALECLKRGIRMGVRVAVASCRALAIDEPDIRETVFRAGVRAFTPDKIDGLDRAILSATYARLARLEAYVASEFEDAVRRSGIGACPEMFALVGQAANASIDDLPAHVARISVKSCGRPRDEHGRFARYRTAGRHRWIR